MTLGVIAAIERAEEGPRMSLDSADDMISELRKP